MELRRKTLILIVLVVMIFTSSCSSVPKEVVKVYNEEMTSVTYNGVEYIEREYSSVDEFLPFLCDYCFVDFEYNLFNREVYFIDESFIADKRDINKNFIYAYSGIFGNSVYERKGFETPMLSGNFDRIDSLVAISYGDDDSGKSYKQTINDTKEILAILNFFKSFEKTGVKIKGTLPTENSEVYIRALSGCFGGAFTVGPENIYFTDGELIAVSDGKQYKAPEEINEIFRNTKRTDYEWGLQILYFKTGE